MIENELFTYTSVYPDLTKIFDLTSNKVNEIKNNCLFVLDTNVLLLPYTSSSGSIQKIKEIYMALIQESELVILGQVAREFAENRPEKIKELFQNLWKKSSSIQEYQIGDYPLLESSKEYKDVLEKQTLVNESIISYRNSVQELVKNIKSWKWDDPVSNLYKEIFQDNVFYDPVFESDFIKLEYERRNHYKIPPGYKDSAKDINACGDLIIWLSILKLAKEKKENIIFVSGEGKSDWVHRSEKQVLYPHFKLQYEFQLVNPNKSFHIIQLSELLKLFNVDYNIVQEIVAEERAQNVNSSNLKAIGYDLATNTLEIEFLNGSLYQYSNVPEIVYQELMAASSHGQYFDTHIKKGGYSYRKLR
jgi:rRNA-processing protein FCF1